MPELISFPFTAMGSDCALHLYAGDPASAAAAAEVAAAEVHRIEARYSRYRPDSFLSRINQAAAAQATIELDEETAELLDYAHACHRQSDGLFDVTVGVLRRAWDFSATCLPTTKAIADLLPRVGLEKLRWQRPHLSFPLAGMELDFGGMAKEYATDRAAAVLAAIGVEHGLVDLGGDIRVLGPHPGGEPWEIQIRHPRQPGAAMATVPLQQGSLASSGDYERYMIVAGTRYCHILDPRTGWSARGLAAVSVWTEQCLVAGSLATIAMLKGQAGIDWLAGLRVPHAWMDEDGRQGGSATLVTESGE